MSNYDVGNGVPGAVKIAIIKDFKDWSGGFAPIECSDEELETYVKLSLPLKLDGQPDYDRKAVIKWLRTLR